jgi:type IV pilus assembly protein PilY1
MEDRVDSTDDVGRLEILAITPKGFTGSQECRDALTYITTHGLNGSKDKITDCTDTFPESNSELADQNPVLNHSLQFCWQLENHQRNLGNVVKECEDIYEGVKVSHPYLPTELDPAYGAYICYGTYDDTVDHVNRNGYVGRCWDPYLRAWAGTWNLNPKEDDLTNPDNCILQASIDYCTDLKVPEVIDPSEEAGDTTNYWNIPGLLTDSEVIAQLGVTSPLAVMKGYIQQSERPKGVLHEVADEIRLGAMAFNYVGAETECKPAYLTSGIDKFCPSDNKDGAHVITPIKQGSLVTDGNDSTYISGKRRHVDDLVEDINKIRATSWTPLAEAMFGALGYFTQNKKLCLNIGENGDCQDWKNATEDPVQYACQDNHIIVITEGESTADIHASVSNFIANPAGFFASPPLTNDNVSGDADGDTSTTCSKLAGSTYFDDMTWWGQHLGPLFVNRQVDGADKRNILTQVIATSPLIPGNDECNPEELMNNAATNGGRPLLTGEDPSQLEENLRSTLAYILSRASAGSAASVISSSKNGEGAAYQAIFWHEIERGSGLDPLKWTGDVHAFFVDEYGLFWDDYSGGIVPAAYGKGVLWSEDTNGNGILDGLPINEDRNGNGYLDGDRRVVTFYDNSTKICFNPSVVETGTCARSNYIYTPATPVELIDFNQYIWSAKDRLAAITDTDIAINRGVQSDGRWDFSTNRRYIFTWNDLDNDGIVDSDYDGDGSVDKDGDEVGLVVVNGDDSEYRDREEILEFVPGMNSALPVGPVASPRGNFLSDFNVSTDDELNKLILWLRGNDGLFETDINSNGILEDEEDINGNKVRDYVLRCRKLDCTSSVDANSPTWRLGDVIHSTPTLVSGPAEGYQFIYSDFSYLQFYKKYKERRNVIYFGANDGMLHAVNGGFYQAGLKKFLPCREDQRNDASNECIVSSPYTGTANNTYPALGDELWAYIPYNLQPHLSCLTNPEYNHKYFVDAPPRIFDVRIFPDDSATTNIHPGGWGTILVGYMRFGGAPTLADSTFPITDNRQFISSYFILDITDPERPPKLLAEMTTTTDSQDLDGDGTPEKKFTRMGYSTAMPTVVAMRNDTGNSEWFLVIGNGPTTIKGENDQQGKVAIIPLNALTGVNFVKDDGEYNPETRKPFRILNAEPSDSTDQFGRLLIEGGSIGNINSFVGDMVSLDADVPPKSVAGIQPYKTDVVYFGTVDGSVFGDDVVTRKKYWDGDGRLFRLVMNPSNSIDANGNQKYTDPDEWQLRKLLDAQGPITAAPNVAYDKSNLWVYFGTGRFYAPEDKTDTTAQYFFGVKEPRNDTCKLSWAKIDWWLSGAPIATNPAEISGKQGLFRTDRARVIESGTSDLFSQVGDYLYCADDLGVACTFPQLTPLADGDDLHTYYSFAELERYIKGEKCGIDVNDTTIGVDGWYRQLNLPRERSLGMPTLLGGLVTYSSYQPSEDACEAEGDSYLYGVYYLTGTAWVENIFGTYVNAERKSIVKDSLKLGKGLVTTPSIQVGSGPNDANVYVQTSTGEIIKVGQENLPIQNFKSGMTNWMEYQQ